MARKTLVIIITEEKQSGGSIMSTIEKVGDKELMKYVKRDVLQDILTRED